MTSFRLSVTPSRRAAARFIGSVRRRLQKAYVENDDVSQSAIANALGVHRSVINRQLKGTQDMNLGRVAEIAWALGLEPVFDLRSAKPEAGSNYPETRSSAVIRPTVTVSQNALSQTRTDALEQISVAGA